MLLYSKLVLILVVTIVSIRCEVPIVNESELDPDAAKKISEAIILEFAETDDKNKMASNLVDKFKKELNGNWMVFVYAIACDIHSSYHYQNKERIHLTYKGYKFEIAKETQVYKHTNN